jgi:hypothetical protein
MKAKNVPVSAVAMWSLWITTIVLVESARASLFPGRQNIAMQE